MLQKISDSNKDCSFELSIHQIWKKYNSFHNTAKKSALPSHGKLHLTFKRLRLSYIKMKKSLFQVVIILHNIIYIFIYSYVHASELLSMCIMLLMNCKM